MKTILLDTNIIIERENPKVPNQSVARLFRFIDNEKLIKYIHPSCFGELGKYHDKKQVAILHAKLTAYNLIDIPKIANETFEQLVQDMTFNENDVVDNQLLFQVYDNRVDSLITEDKKMLQKANKLKIRSKVFTIDEYIHLYIFHNPRLIDYPVLSVKQEKFKNIKLSDSFFDFFRIMYPGFEKWFNKKFDEDAYVVNGELGLEGFLYIKTEDTDEPYGHFSKTFSPKKRLKIGTFKVVSTGYRLGERFVKIIIDNALKRNVDEIYVTIFKNEESVKPLVGLLESWGFSEYCIKTDTNESVMIKDLRNYNTLKSPKYNFPLFKNDAKHYFLPIEQNFHIELFPDSALYREMVKDGKKPYQYALLKTYISFSYTAPIAKPGDVLLIYRKGDKLNAGYTGVISTITIVEKVIRIDSLNHLLSECENRTVFTKEQLIEFYHTQKNIFVVKLLHRHTLKRKIILKQLWEWNIVEFPNGPRPFASIETTAYNKILEIGQRDTK
jgi:predicted nucleic acid-binding protein